MRRLCYGAALLLTVVTLSAMEVKSPFMTAQLSPRGAMLTALTVKGKAWHTSLKELGSFTDRLCQNISENTQGFADTSKLDFNLKTFHVAKSGTTVTFSGCIGVIPGLIMEKTYFFSNKTPSIKISYFFRNTSQAPIPLGLYTRLFFRTPNGKQFYFQPGETSPRKIMPGETSLPIKLPSRTFLAVADEDNKGFLLKLPVSNTAGVLNWLIEGGYTQEYIGAQHTIAPGGFNTLSLECIYSENLSAAMESADLKAQKLSGTLPVQVDRMTRIKPKAGVQFLRSIPTPKETFIDCSFVRQLEDTWRAVELPEGKEKAALAVYPLENGVINTSMALEFTRRDKHLLIKVPGVAAGKVVYVERCNKDGDFVHNLGGKTWYGALTMKCRILFGDTKGKELAKPEIPAQGALICNGDMEKSLSAKPKCPLFMPYALNAWYQAGVQKESSGNKFLRIGRQGFYNFFPEYGKEYTLTFRARSVGGGGLTRIFIQFYDKSGKYMNQPQRIVVLSSRNTFGWKKFEQRFFVPSNVAFLRILFLNGQKKGQFIDIDDLQLTLPAESLKSRDRKTVLRDEMIKLWTIPLDLIEPVSHKLVTPHKKWFSPAAEPVKDVLFVSGFGTRISEGRRREIVELAQRMDMEYKHLPLIQKIKNVLKAYSVYPTYFHPQVSEYTMECLKEIKNPPRIICFTGVIFSRIKDQNFISFLKKWQKQGVNFLFYRCANVPKSLLGKEIPREVEALLPAMSSGTGFTEGFCRFYKSGNSLTAVVGRTPLKNALVPDNLRFYAKYGYALPYGFEYPWWEYDYLLDLHVFRRLAGIKSPARLTRSSGAFAVKADKDFTGKVEVVIENMLRKQHFSKSYPVKLSAGKEVAFPDNFKLPGGTFVANLRLFDAKGKIVDAGAIKLTRKEITPLSITLKSKERIFPHPQKAEFTVNVPKLPAGAKVEVEIFNQRSETLFRSAPVAKKQLDLAVSLPHLRTFYNYIRANVVRNGELIASVTEEFSVPGIPKKMNDFYGFTNPGQFGGAPIKDLEFDFSITGDPRWLHTPGSVRRIRTMGLIPIPRRGDEKMFRPYRDDVKSAPVRKPCFTSPEFHAQLQKDTKFMAENCKFRYNDVNLLWSGDEMFLGRSVCTSPSCLAGFRNRLKKSFGTIEALNSNWGSSFKSFDEVVPSQLDAIKDKNRLGPWLDHKMFMTTVFAENFFGKAKDELEKYVPNVKIGPTGTQKPGFGYNWHELMKYCRIVGYYSGVQTKVIHDLSDATLMAGQCGGGYTHGHMNFEVYNYNTMWTTLLNGGNLAYHYHGCAYRGDGAPTENMVYYQKSLRELKSGVGKLYLCAQPDFKVAILYSQPSLFAAMGSCGQDEWQNSQTSWAKLLDDLRVSARFINYEELADKGVPAGIKAVVLPFSLALSDKEIASLKSFVSAGGLVLSDRDAGIFDEHGRKRSAKELQKLDFINSLDFSIARYNFVQLGGTGGEVSSSGSGDETFIRTCRSKVGAVLSRKNITPFVVLKDAKGAEFGCTAKFRRDGTTRIYGFHLEPDESKPAAFKDLKPTKVKVHLPLKGHVYEVRSQRYLGLTKAFDMALVPGWSMIYAVLPEKPESLVLNGPAKAERGKAFKCTFRLSPAMKDQVYRVTFSGADGKELKQFSRNLHQSEGCDLEFFMPHNFPCGKYTLKVTHVATGVTAQKVIDVR